MSGVVVHDEMDVEIGRHAGLDLVEELAELAGAMLRVAAAEDGAGGDVEGGKQRGRTMTRVVVAAPRDLTGPHRQEGLGPIERLDLGLLVDAQHQRPVGRTEIEPDDIAHLLDKQRVGGELEGLAPVRLQAERLPDAVDRRGP